jgi:hypothetical protein
VTLIRKSFKVPEGAILPNVSSFDLTSVKPSGLCHFMQVVLLQIENGVLSEKPITDKKLETRLRKLIKRKKVRFSINGVEYNGEFLYCLFAFNENGVKCIIISWESFQWFIEFCDEFLYNIKK